MAFTLSELEILADFNNILNKICDKMQKPFPHIYEFVSTNNWCDVNQAAIATLIKLKENC